ncbi:MAG: hypothetical protein IT523_02010 [Burkholderiales bacterium]|nr:hypothetical protein [Burkholderiales bacterium]
MREIIDGGGMRWLVAPLEASYGHVLLLFSPAEGEGIRHKTLPVEHLAEAEQWLLDLPDADLMLLLSTATPWDPSTPTTAISNP